MFRSCFRHRFTRMVACALIVLLAIAGPVRAVGDFQIHLEYGDGAAVDPAAQAAFQRAANAWSQFIASPIRVNIFVDVVPVDSTSIIGGTALGPINPNLPFDTVRNAMAARANRPGDAILASLPTAAQVSANVPTNFGGTFDNTMLGVTSANQKALGLLPDPLHSTELDGYVIFNSNFAFDYDQSDGVDSGKFDFQTAATHEIGHVLGFLSDVDEWDASPSRLDDATTLDMFRFNSGNLPTTPQQFRDFPRELTPGAPAALTDLDAQYAFSTGQFQGDGNQASHWQDDFLFDPNNGILIFGPLIGIMDPTLSSGTIEDISAADLRAMELIGYDTVPEPSTGLLIGSVVILAMRRRRGMTTLNDQ